MVYLYTGYGVWHRDHVWFIYILGIVSGTGITYDLFTYWVLCLAQTSRMVYLHTGYGIWHRHHVWFIYILGMVSGTGTSMNCLHTTHAYLSTLPEDVTIAPHLVTRRP